MPTIADQGITHGTITLYEQGDWFGDVSTNSGERIADGTRVSIVVENVTLSGSIVRGDISGDFGRYQIAGRPELDKRIRPRAYQLASVPRSVVFADIMLETFGASWQTVVVSPPEKMLGGHFERAGTNGSVVVTARDALNTLGLSWYVRNDGVVVFGTRASGDVATDERILVSDRNQAIGLRYVNCDDVAAFVPGVTFEGETIGELSYLITPEDVSLQVWTRAASNAPLDWLRTAWRRLFPRVELQGLYSYSTAGITSNGKHSLRSTQSRHLPDIGLADAWTIAGHAADLAPGTRVLVAFADGNPATPVIVAIDSATLPVTSSFETTGTLSADGASVDLGDALSHVITAGIAVTIDGPNPVAGVIRLDPLDPVRIIPTKVKA